jgi:hypothetical protein
MADNYNITVLMQIAQANVGAFVITPPQQTGTPKYSVSAQILANGDNTFTVPTNAAWALIVFDPTSVTVKKLKGAGGDTGITLSANGLALIPVASANIIINSSALDTGLYTRIYWC